MSDKGWRLSDFVSAVLHLSTESGATQLNLLPKRPPYEEFFMFYEIRNVWNCLYFTWYFSVVCVLYNVLYCLCCINVFVLCTCCKKNRITKLCIVLPGFLPVIFWCYIFGLYSSCCIFVFFFHVVFSCCIFACVEFSCYIFNDVLFVVVFSCYIFLFLCSIVFLYIFCVWFSGVFSCCIYIVVLFLFVFCDVYLVLYYFGSYSSCCIILVTLYKINMCFIQ